MSHKIPPIPGPQSEAGMLKNRLINSIRSGDLIVEGLTAKQIAALECLDVDVAEVYLEAILLGLF